MKAPDFSLPDEHGTTHNLSDYRGTWVVVYFYPRDNTPGCTTEACSFRDNLEIITKRGIVVLGISKDSVTSHKKFTEKFSLNFHLLSDESKETIKAFGAWGKKKFMGREFDGVLRNTYIIDPAGDIRKTYEKVDPKTHVEQLLTDITQLQSGKAILT